MLSRLTLEMQAAVLRGTDAHGAAGGRSCVHQVTVPCPAYASRSFVNDEPNILRPGCWGPQITEYHTHTHSLSLFDDTRRANQRKAHFSLQVIPLPPFAEPLCRDASNRLQDSRSHTRLLRDHTLDAVACASTPWIV